MGLFRRGGKRKGAGRKPRGERPSEKHATRERVTKHTPVHVTMRVVKLPTSFRTRVMFDAVQRASATAAKRLKIRIVHASVQSNHIHVIAEAEDQYALAKGVQGFQISIAKIVNRVLARKGRVFQDRYHAHVLKTPRETRNAVNYVLQNWKHHGLTAEEGDDPFSSATEGMLRVWSPRCWLLARLSCPELAGPGPCASGR